MLLKLRESLRSAWYLLGVPGLALTLWWIGSGAYYFRLMDRHAVQLGSYQAPAKVAERKRTKGMINAANIVLMTCVAFHARRRKFEQEARERRGGKVTEG